jgi:hypothetical protein
LSCAFTLGPGSSSTPLASGGKGSGPQPVPVLLSTFQLSRCLAYSRRELRSPGCLRNGHLRRFHRFRSVPSAKVVSHICCDLSRGFQTSFCKLPASLSFPLLSGYHCSFNQQIAHLTLFVRCALLHWREVVSHNFLKLSMSFGHFFSRGRKLVEPLLLSTPLRRCQNTEKARRHRDPWVCKR